MQQRQCFLCAETYLQVRLFITQAVDSFRFINQSVKEQLHGIEHFIIGNTAYNKVVICRIFSTAAVQNEIQPFSGIRIEFQRFQFRFPAFIVFIPRDNAIFPTAFELTAPLRCLFIQRRDIEATPESLHWGGNEPNPALQSLKKNHDKESYFHTPFFHHIKEIINDIFPALGMQHFIFRHDITVQNIALFGKCLIDTLCIHPQLCCYIFNANTANSSSLEFLIFSSVIICQPFLYF